jgi:cysteine desulfurase
MWQKNVRYLDYNATSGLSNPVREKLTELLRDPEILANPSSRHRPGQRARKLIYDSTLRIAKSLSGDRLDSVSPDELLFTSSGTEANQTVLRSISKQTSLIIIGAGEHSSSRDWAENSVSFKTEELNLLANGQYDFNHLLILLKNAESAGLPRVGLSLTLANNETGVLLDVEGLKKVIEASGISVILHLDGAQVWGKTPLNLAGTSAHYITFSSHKIGAPSGNGVIFMRKGSELDPLIFGSQSKGLRGGSENLIGIAALGFAAEQVDPQKFEQHTRPLTKHLEAGLKQISKSIRIWGEESPRVPNTSRFSFLNFKTYENWVELLDLNGYAVSHGSACKAQIIEPSRVLLKMGACREDALNSLRISFGPGNTIDDVDGFLQALRLILAAKGETGS